MNSGASSPPPHNPGGGSREGGPLTPGRSSTSKASEPSARSKNATLPSVLMPPTAPSWLNTGVTKKPETPCAARSATQRIRPCAVKDHNWFESEAYTLPSGSTIGALTTAA